MSTPAATPDSLVAETTGSGDYFHQGPLIEVDITEEDPEFTRDPSVLGDVRIESPPETSINLDPIVSTKDADRLDAVSASQLEFEDLNTKNPDVLDDADSVTDGSEYRDDSWPGSDSNSESDPEFEPEPEMTELDSTEEWKEKDARIHAMAAKIHHRLAEEKERVGLNSEEEEMLRSLEERSDYVSESDDGSHVTSIPQSQGGVAVTLESAEVNPSDLYPASPPISVQNQSDREYFDPSTAMPTSLLPTDTDTGTSPPARGLSPALTSLLSTEETAAHLGDPSDRDSARRLAAIEELDSVADSGQTMSPAPFATDKDFMDRLDGIHREFPSPDLSSTSLSDLNDDDDVISVRSVGKV